MTYLSQSAQNLRPSVFAQLVPKIKALGERCIPLHIGDTYRLPPAATREALRDAINQRSDTTRYFTYTHPFGRAELLEAVVDKLARDNQISATVDQLQVTCGATQGLAAVAQATLNPGDEVLVFCPYWPLIKGVIATVGGVPREVHYARAVADPEGVLGPLVSPRTKAIYLANPNNPDGQVLGEEEARRLYEFAQRHDLLIWTDEAYEHIVFDQNQRVSLGSLDRDQERPRVISVFTFSKSFGLAGLRIGYVCAPLDVMQGLRRVSNHQTYNLSDLVQEAALAALTQPAKEYREFLDRQASDYQAARDLLLTAFPDAARPQGGAYLFIDLETPERAWNTLNTWLEHGLSCAPGEAFGSFHHHHLRLCFTAVPLERLSDAVEVVKAVGPVS